MAPYFIWGKTGKKHVVDVGVFKLGKSEFQCNKIRGLRCSPWAKQAISKWMNIRTYTYQKFTSPTQFIHKSVNVIFYINGMRINIIYMQWLNTILGSTLLCTSSSCNMYLSITHVGVGFTYTTLLHHLQSLITFVSFETGVYFTTLKFSLLLFHS